MWTWWHSSERSIIRSSRIAALAVGPDGLVHIVQPQDRQVTVLTREGELVRRLGGAGSGPGEFLAPGSLGWFADTLWVLDVGNQRTTLFHGEEVVRTQQQRTIESTRAENVAAVFAAPEGASMVLVRRNPGPQALAPNRNGYLIRVDPASARQDTIAVLIENHPARIELSTARGGGGYLRTPPLFTDFPHLQIPSSRKGAVVADRPFPEGSRSEIRVSRMDLWGDTVFSVRLEGDAVHLEDSEWDERMRARWSLLERSGVDRRDFLDAHERPRYHAPASSMKVGGGGWIWIAREDLANRDEREWVAIDPDGVPRFRLTLPSDFRVYEVDGEEVWGVIPGEWDEEIVRAYRVHH